MTLCFHDRIPQISGTGYSCHQRLHIQSNKIGKLERSHTHHPLYRYGHGSISFRNNRICPFRNQSEAIFLVRFLLRIFDGKKITSFASIKTETLCILWVQTVGGCLLLLGTGTIAAGPYQKENSRQKESDRISSHQFAWVEKERALIEKSASPSSR